MNISLVTVGVYQTNCYLLEEDGHTLIIDPGSRYQKILCYIKEDTKVDGILVTHGHVDHIGAVDKLAKLYQCPIYISKEDEIMARDPYLNLSEEDSIVIHSPVQHLKEGTYQIGHFSVQVYETPGHTPGSLMFRIGNELFSGDTLFRLSIGRTDLPLGSNSEMRSSLQLIKTLDPSLRVYPGHEEVTTLEYELEHNPYLY